MVVRRTRDWMRILSKPNQPAHRQKVQLSQYGIKINMPSHLLQFLEERLSLNTTSPPMGSEATYLVSSLGMRAWVCLWSPPSTSLEPCLSAESMCSGSLVML